MLTTSDLTNPLLPAGFDVAFTVVPLALVAIVIVTMVSIVRRYRSLSVWESVGWTALVIMVPVVGSLVWFLAGRSRHRLRSAAG